MPFLDASALNDNREDLSFLRSVLRSSGSQAAPVRRPRWADTMSGICGRTGSGEAEPSTETLEAGSPEHSPMPVVVGVAVPASIITFQR
jgi:hypothetical protein